MIFQCTLASVNLSPPPGVPCQDDLGARQEGPAASIKYIDRTVCREIEKTDSDTERIPEYSSTCNTGTGSFPVNEKLI